MNCKLKNLTETMWTDLADIQLKSAELNFSNSKPMTAQTQLVLLINESLQFTAKIEQFKHKLSPATYSTLHYVNTSLLQRHRMLQI